MQGELGKSLHVSHRPLGTEAHSWGGDKHVVLAPSSLGKPLLGAAAGGEGQEVPQSVCNRGWRREGAGAQGAQVRLWEHEGVSLQHRAETGVRPAGAVQ